MQRTLIIFTALLVFAACSSTPKKKYDPAAFTPVNVIELRDATDPLLLASTSAGRVREFIVIGLKHRGYVVCHPCSADATATVTVRKYTTEQKTKGTFWGASTFDVAEVDFTLVIVRNGETILQGRQKDNENMTIDQLAAREVRDALEKIPHRQVKQ